MASKKTHDLSVKVGTYVKDGAEKGRYKNVGMILTKEDGGEMLMIDPTFNFAAVQRDAGRDYVILSKFEVKDENKKPVSAPQFEE
jgi:hypothetical protein